MHVLTIVDDDPDIRMIASLALGQVDGFEVSAAADGKECVRRAMDGERWDLALLDVMMPGLDGPATLQKLRELGLDLPCVFFTARVQRQDVEAYQQLGAAGTIEKPFDPMTLGAQIRDILASVELPRGPVGAVTASGMVLALITFSLALTRFGSEGMGSDVGRILAVTAALFAAIGVARMLPSAVRGALLVATGLGGLGTMALAEAGLHSEAMFWLPFTPIAAALLVNQTGAVVVAVVATVLAAGLTVAAVPQEGADAVFQGMALGGATWFGTLLSIAYDRQRRAEAADLRDREDRQRQLLDVLPLCVLLLDDRGAVLHASNVRAAIPHAEASAFEAARTLESLGTVGAVLCDCMKQALATAGPSQASTDVGSGAATRSLQVHAVPVARGRVALTIADVSEQQQVSRLKDEFVSTVSHELRTPLAATLGSLHLLQSGMAHLSSEQIPALLEVAVRNGRRLSRIVEDLLDLQKLESGGFEIRPVAVGLCAAAERVCAELGPLADERGIELVVARPTVLDVPHPVGGDRDTSAEDGIQVHCDPDRLQQILVNLVGNAVKFSAPAARITVRVLGRQEAGVVQVEDQGPGIPASEHERVFERFRQLDSATNRAGSGTGLGLSISRALARHMNGDLTLHSVAGEGSTFTLSLPRLPLPDAAQPAS